MRIAVLLVLGGCVFNSVSAEERLRDSVVGLNDETRWNRLDLAAQRVAPAFIGRFRATHHSWHRELQIADSEIVNVEIGEGREEATSFVTVRWYDQRTMLLSETTLKQKWRRALNGFVMIDEDVADGNPRLLELPEAFRTEPEDEPEDEPEAEPVAEPELARR